MELSQLQLSGPAPGFYVRSAIAEANAPGAHMFLTLCGDTALDRICSRPSDPIETILENIDKENLPSTPGKSNDTNLSRPGTPLGYDMEYNQYLAQKRYIGPRGRYFTGRQY